MVTALFPRKVKDMVLLEGRVGDTLVPRPRPLGEADRACRITRIPTRRFS